MKTRLDKGFVAVAAYLLTRFDLSRERLRDDRGDVVSTLVLVVGFAILAGALVLTISGKVKGWIAKIPNP